jgi:sestrin
MRNIVALMAAVRFKSSYIVQEQERQFRMNNGPPEWLKGYSHFPSKLQQLSEINALLAHQPWRINKDHIAKLFKSTVGWTIAGLIDAILIMSHSRSMSAFALAMGLFPEVEFKDKPVVTPTEVYEDKSDDNKTAEVINKLSKQCIWKPGQKKPTLLSLSFEQFAASATPPELSAQREENGDTLSVWEWSNIEARYQDPFAKMIYHDFDVNSKEYSYLNIQDFSWANQGFSLLRQFNNVSAQLLDNCFNCIRSLTYKSFHCQKAVDTEPFRMAIWYYVHRLHGIFHDDYDYAQVNKWPS